MTVTERLVEQALRIREVEERLLKLFAEGRLHGTIHSCVGQEFSAVCIADHLTAQDRVFTNHRGHGHFIAATKNSDGLIREIAGRQGGVCEGRGGSQHLHFENVYANGVQGSLVPVAAGSALAFRQNGERSISVVFIGDGTLGQGVLWETLNLAAVWKLPLLIVVEDNGIAQSTVSHSVFRGTLEERIKGFGVRYYKGDTATWSKLYEDAKELIASIREGAGPAVLHIATARLRAHSKGDDTRTADEVATLWALDPLQKILQTEQGQTLHSKIKTEVDLAFDSALKAPPARNDEHAGDAVPSSEWREVTPPSIQGTYSERLNLALNKLFAADPSAVLLGEDVEDPYGGCFKVTRGLSQKFGTRVRNTPISEAALAGVATGYALTGRTALAEFMFGDFMLLAMDQIVNTASKLFALHSARPLNVVFRAPMGGGRGYGATHSQNLEKHFLGVAALKVCVLNSFIEPSEFFDSRVRRNAGPCVLIENKNLYTRAPVTFGTEWKIEREVNSLDTRIVPADVAPQAVVVAHGAYADLAWEALCELRERLSVPCAALLVGTLSGYSIERDLDWLRECGGSILVLEEGSGYVSFASEFIAQASEAGLRATRWSPPEQIIPAAPALEATMRLSTRELIAEVLEIVQ